jgi:zinc and cadmium transporter
MAIYWVIGVCFAGGLTSLFLASLIFKEASQGLINNMVSLAVGTLLTTAFLEIIPHAIEEANNNSHDISFMVLIGILVFFVLEKLFIWRHCHGPNCNKHEDCESSSPSTNNINGKGSIVFIGDLFHNFVDGILIASAFLVNINLGIVTALSMLLHCLPQEMGTFSVLLHSGVSKFRAYILNIASSIATLVGALLAFYILSIMQEFIPYVLALAASSMIYIAISDLMPGLHKKTEIKDSIKQISIISLGVIIIFFIHSFLH